MVVKLGIKETKKFAIGTIHENGSGKFEILDRYIDNNVIMIKYRYVDTGEVAVNKEINLTASIWKFKKVRGLTQTQVKENQLKEETYEFKDFKKLVEETFGRMNDHLGNKVNFMESLSAQITNLQEQNLKINQSIEQLLVTVKDNQREIEILTKNHDLINKLIEKL